VPHAVPDGGRGPERAAVGAQLPQQSVRVRRVQHRRRVLHPELDRGGVAGAVDGRGVAAIVRAPHQLLEHPTRLGVRSPPPPAAAAAAICRSMLTDDGRRQFLAPELHADRAAARGVPLARARRAARAPPPADGADGVRAQRGAARRAGVDHLAHRRRHDVLLRAAGRRHRARGARVEAARPRARRAGRRGEGGWVRVDAGVVRAHQRLVRRGPRRHRHAAHHRLALGARVRNRQDQLRSWLRSFFPHIVLSSSAYSPRRITANLTSDPPSHRRMNCVRPPRSIEKQKTYQPLTRIRTR